MILSKNITSSIGGYFELELQPKAIQLYSNAIKFQSARAAFLALLRTGKPRQVWMPRYICDVMFAPLEITNTKFKLYDLNDNFSVADNVNLESGDWLLYVNYFGICEPNIAGLIKRFPNDQLILDFSQSFFEPPPNVMATIYSPRKFFGLPDGGLLINQLGVPLPEIQDKDSLGRISHLLQRIEEEPNTGYAAYQQAEASLTDCTPKRISKFTERLLSSIDFESVNRRRIENFNYLHKKLGANNLICFNLAEITNAPLCYPFQVRDHSLRKQLIDNKIYIPMYWKDAISRVSKTWAWSVIENCLPLPIDQRYDIEDMERIVSVIQEKDKV